MQTLILEEQEMKAQWEFEVRVVTTFEDKYILCMIGRNFLEKNMRHLAQITLPKSGNEQLEYAYQWCNANPDGRLNQTATPKVYVDFGSEVVMERPASTNVWNITGVSGIRIIDTNVPEPAVFPEPL